MCPSGHNRHREVEGLYDWSSRVHFRVLFGSVAPTPSTILPSATTTFALTRVADTVSGMRFVYTSGNKNVVLQQGTRSIQRLKPLA